MEGRYRNYHGRTAIAIRSIAIAVPVLATIYIFDVPRRYFNFLVFHSSYTSFFLSLVLLLVFLRIPATKSSPTNKLPWYDALLAVLGLIGCLYLSVNFPSIYILDRVYATTAEIILFFITLIVISEAIRRTLGWSILILGILFLFHAKFAYLFPGLLGGPKYSLSDLTCYIYLYQFGFFGMVLEIAATIIIIFLVFGSFLQEAGAGKFFTDLALSVAGHMRGGPAKVAVISSAFFGTISGSPVANVGTTGAITIPMMKNIGYQPHFAAAVESVASTGGVVMPPVMGAVAFIMAEYTKMGYTAVCIAAILPAILYFICVFAQLDLEAAKLGLSGLPREQLPGLRATLKQGWPFLIPLLFLVVLLMVIQYDPLESIFYTILVLIIVSWFKKETRMGVNKILNGLENGTRSIFLVAPICAFVGILTGSVALTGLGVNLSVILVEFAAGSLIVLAVLAGLVVYLMGMGIGAIITYILLAIIVAPAMVKIGVPVMVAHMFIFYMGCSMFFTPPNCPAVFVASGIAGSKIFRTGFTAMRLGIICYLVPFVILYNPALILIGQPTEIVLSVTTSVLGVFSLAAGIEGYLFTESNWWQRVLFIGGGVCLFIPGWLSDVIGLALLALPVIAQWRKKQRLLVDHRQ